MTEHVFYTPQALVQVLADDAPVTQRFSITVIDDRFSFRAGELTFDQTDISLGTSTFWNLSEQQTGQLLGVGAHRFTYVEAHQFGSAAADQLYLFAFNDVGIGAFDYLALHEARQTRVGDGVFAAEPSESLVATMEDLRSFRRSTTINTLTVVGALAEPRLTTLMPYGVDLDFVRVFRPAMKQHRQRAAEPARGRPASGRYD